VVSGQGRKLTMGFREDMPVFARHEGQWAGEYIHVDSDGVILDRHSSKITVEFRDTGRPYYQTNEYTWSDGRREFIEFPADYGDGKVLFDTDRITGHAWEIDPRTIMLTWSYKHDPEQYLYETIQIDTAGQHRARTWHWFENGELVKRTLIKEHRLA
jgi:hypothetical protein